jgi:HK97 family phage prohead protease
MSKKMEFKEFDLEFKAEDCTEDDEFKTFRGMLSPYDGKADYGGDIVEEGAYKRSLDQKGLTRTLLWHHQSKEPIGSALLRDTKEGLIVEKGKIAKGVQRGKETAILMNMDAVKGLSIGYVAEKVAYKTGNRILKEIALHEASIVPFPMNGGATIYKAEGNVEDALEYCLLTLESATKEDVEKIKDTITKFKGLLFKLDPVDPLRSAEEKQRIELAEEIDRKIILDFNNFLKDTLKCQKQC